MFERYTEKARRVIFCARYEASQLRSPYIEAEHLLLGLLREQESALKQLLPLIDQDAIRKEIRERTSVEHPGNIIDLPLSNEAKRVLAFAAEEAERLSHRHIGPEHFLLALLRESTPAAEFLKKNGARLSVLRKTIAENPWRPTDTADPVRYVSRVARDYPSPTTLDTIEIHGRPRNADYIRRSVKTFCEVRWHWEKREWTPRDVAIHRKTGAISFDIALAGNSKNFKIMQGGWQKDDCAICGWELYASKDAPDHAAGYTNGRDWLCAECHDKFIQRKDFFASTYPDIT